MGCKRLAILTLGFFILIAISFVLADGGFPTTLSSSDSDLVGVFYSSSADYDVIDPSSVIEELQKPAVLEEEDYCVDKDGDGYTYGPFCILDLQEDCDDTDGLVYPRAEELFDGKDNDCNGKIDDNSIISKKNILIQKSRTKFDKFVDAVVSFFTFLDKPVIDEGYIDTDDKGNFNFYIYGSGFYHSMEDSDLFFEPYTVLFYAIPDKEGNLRAYPIGFVYENKGYIRVPLHGLPLPDTDYWILALNVVRNGDGSVAEVKASNLYYYSLDYDKGGMTPPEITNAYLDVPRNTVVIEGNNFREQEPPQGHSDYGDGTYMHSGQVGDGGEFGPGYFTPFNLIQAGSPGIIEVPLSGPVYGSWYAILGNVRFNRNGKVIDYAVGEPYVLDFGPPVCGNGFVEGDEQCDDGNTNSGDGCSSSCITESCGDGAVQGGLGEVCDPPGSTQSCITVGGYNGTRACNDQCTGFGNCTSSQYCGDGIKNGLEQCDDGNTNSGDGCSSSCVTESCGDNITQSGLGEECDGSDDAACNGEVCLGNCVCDDGSGAVCGNGVCESGENGVNCPSDCGSPVTGMVGINFHWVTDWSPSSPFVDVFKQSRNFIMNQGYTCLDQYGWPTQAPCNGATPITYLMTVGTWPSGAYTLKTSGTGTIQVTGRGINQQFTSPGTYTLNLSQGSILSMRFLTSSASDPIHEVHLFLPGYANAGEHDLNPHFVDQWDEFKVTRLLNFYNALNTPVEKWSDRRLLTEETFGFTTNGPAQTKTGVPPEYTYMYANAANSDVWITIPHKVNPDEQLDENYPKQLAMMLKNNLNPNLRVWVEYSNELWNSDFAAYEWIDDAAVAKWGSNCVTGSQYCRHDYVVWASAKMWEIFENELGSDRVVKVLPGWTAPGNYNQLLVNRLNNTVLNPNNVRPDVLAIAPYFSIFVDARRNPSQNDFVNSGCYLEPNAVDIVLDMLQNAINGTSNNHPSCPGYSSTKPILKNYLPAHIALANNNSMELVAYESGQSLISRYPGNASIQAALNSIFTAVNRHPRMEQVYKSYYNTWFDLGGSTTNHLGNIAAPGPDGYWGLLEWEWQDPSGTPYAPKWFAVQDYLG